MTLLNHIGYLDELNGMKKLSARELEFMQYMWTFPCIDGFDLVNKNMCFDAVFNHRGILFSR